MDKSGKGWYVALYGSMFTAMFGIVFIIMIVYRNAGFQYFPDWDSFILGYTSSLNQTWVGQGFNGIKSGFHFVSGLMQDMLTFGRWGQDDWYKTLAGGLNILLGAVPTLILAIAMLILGVSYIFFLTIPLLTSLGYIAGVHITAHNITGGAGIASYFSGVGYPPIESFDFSSFLI